MRYTYVKVGEEPGTLIGENHAYKNIDRELPPLPGRLRLWTGQVHERIDSVCIGHDVNLTGAKVIMQGRWAKLYPIFLAYARML